MCSTRLLVPHLFSVHCRCVKSSVSFFLISLDCHPLRFEVTRMPLKTIAIGSQAVLTHLLPLTKNEIDGAFAFMFSHLLRVAEASDA